MYSSGRFQTFYQGKNYERDSKIRRLPQKLEEFWGQHVMIINIPPKSCLILR